MQPPQYDRRSELNPGRLKVHILVERMQGPIVAVAGLLDAAERHGVVGAAIGVDMDDAGPDAVHLVVGA